MYSYQPGDVERRFAEGAKGSAWPGADVERRGTFARDRARVLHSGALRRLADKTQVVGPRDGDNPRTRLTHSLEVAQIARSLGAGLGMDPDLCELAGLCHDIGHPPYGHNGETALNEVAEDCGGFEGNAQTLRILVRLEPKVVDQHGESMGLNLSRAALDAACKYPVLRTAPDLSLRKKYGCYDEDRSILEWIRKPLGGNDSGRRSMEAQVMDWADDIAYSVHDVEDGIVSGRVHLAVLEDLVELAALAEKGARIFGGRPEELVDAAANLWALPVVSAAAQFDGSLGGFVALKKMTSELVGRFIGATLSATRHRYPEDLGRHRGNLIIPDQAAAEVKLLKTIAVLYVMDEPSHLGKQDRQRDRIFRVFDYLMAGAPGALDPMFAQWWRAAESESAAHRVVIDNIASMTESRLERLDRIAAKYLNII
ncbi:deoxyguanosinetriphosphate triphosphohydrolase [Corynebacterium poyangense]|uniref:Deoxyguanosinetriphosphate triphosphohydrolase-like protein n=1 Tax=Corynebacterium poyangense TaxID=2684405 RepID=A0A7H0SQ07_9CORY|nr:deoxyguanosinetriphosphate triphosphohydrolase [Corynebacterium poyangense]QNQ90632.1 deoxyguanosinetriphosphate triphosphohydrolase [Corynebacterium poyangense]